MDNSVLVRLGRIAVAIVLLVAGASKVRRLRTFRGALDASRLLSAPGATLVMVGVPAAELLLPIWLLVSVESRAAAWAADLLLAIFTGYVFTLRALRREAPCHCFGNAGRITDPMVGRNLGLMALVSAGIVGRHGVYFIAVGAALSVYWAAAIRQHGSRVALLRKK
jgi:uncharacterized membrane protein YphA (DoxX/SURF4 family)